MAVDRRYASTIAIFASVLFLALSICASGLISLFANREVLTETDAGPLVAATSRHRRGVGFVAALVIGAIVFLVFNLTGATLYVFGSGEPVRGILFFASNALGPFSIAVALIAVVVALLYLILMSYRERGGATRTPRWPWEEGDDRDREGRE
jgi:heme/copper-type cytochrome/quinol oxidase subunit 2